MGTLMILALNLSWHRGIVSTKLKPRWSEASGLAQARKFNIHCQWASVSLSAKWNPPSSPVKIRTKVWNQDEQRGAREAGHYELWQVLKGTRTATAQSPANAG